MTMKTTLTVALAAMAIAATPAFAQTQGSNPPSDPTQTGSMSTGSMQSGTMQSGAMGDGAMAPKMTSAQMRTMKKCQAMSSAMMAKNKTCTKMMAMHPEMSNSGGM